MNSQPFAAMPVACRPPLPVKIVIAGAVGAGKTTAVAQISETPVLTVEAPRTEIAAEANDTLEVPQTPGATVAWDSTVAMDSTVGLDFGSVMIDDGMKLCVFGTPAQDRCDFVWRDLTVGAMGALVIVDSRRLDECDAAVDYVDYLQRTGVPFAVAVNLFDGMPDHHIDAVRWALPLADGTPIITIDVRDRGSVLDALLAVLRRRLAMVS